MVAPCRDIINIPDVSGDSSISMNQHLVNHYLRIICILISNSDAGRGSDSYPALTQGLSMHSVRRLPSPVYSVTD